jgi:hypothetical protein
VFYISTEATIGNYAHIAPYTVIIGGIMSKLVMEDFSGIAAGCKIIWVQMILQKE